MKKPLIDTKTHCDYLAFIVGLKDKIRAARSRAVLSVNCEMILLYWQIGHEILVRQKDQGWGAKVIEKISRDLLSEFPDMKGFSSRNLLFMRMLALEYPDQAMVKQVVSLLPWGHLIRILQMVKSPDIRNWYMRQAVAGGWSRDILVANMKNRLYSRQGKAVTNFDKTVPSMYRDAAKQALKDPYIFDFLNIGDQVVESDIEHQMMAHLRKFLLELGAGFAFVGQQVHLEVDGVDYMVDLLFYHVRLHCYIVVELKAGEFKPEHAGQLNFYLSAVDAKMRTPGDKPAIGLLLCRGRKKMTVEYALRNVVSPIGVADWQAKMTSSLPKDLRSSLPTVEEIEQGLR